MKTKSEHPWKQNKGEGLFLKFSKKGYCLRDECHLNQ